MAANLQGGRALAGGLGKRLANQIWIGGSRDPAPLFSSPARVVHVSAYDKNPDDPVRPSAVPDYVIPLKSDKYWGPNPKTGVFGPADENGCSSAVDAAAAAAASPGNGGDTVLDQTVWFRPQEDVDNPPVA